MHNKLHESADVLRLDFDGWLEEHYTAWPHQGYRNLGKRPIKRIDELIMEQSAKEEDAVVEKSLVNARNDT